MDTELPFTIQHPHIYGDYAILHKGHGLVDNAPDERRAQLIVDALNACFTESMHWAVPAFLALKDEDYIITERVLRYLGKFVQYRG